MLAAVHLQVPKAQGTPVSSLLRHGPERTPGHSPQRPPGQHRRNPVGHPGQDPARLVPAYATRTAHLP
eukprot:7499539-Pyramimonas_sp.AAC.1